MNKNNDRNTLLYLRQFGFSDKTLSTIFENEESILEVMFDKKHPFYNKYYEIYNDKEKILSQDLFSLIEFNERFIKVMNEYKKKGIKILYKYSEEFPSFIFPSNSSPLFLYSYGNQKLLEPENKKVAIIGTRSSSENGEKKTREFVEKYVEEKWITVSGLAKGIDTVVHNETIEFGGFTIAVLPTSFDKIYPVENNELFKKIVRRGSLAVTTVGPFDNTYKSTFLDRNTIVAQISDEVLVIEATAKSGTLNTVRQAHNLGKKIYYDEKLLDAEVINYIKKFNANNYNQRWS